MYCRMSPQVTANLLLPAAAIDLFQESTAVPWGGAEVGTAGAVWSLSMAWEEWVRARAFYIAGIAVAVFGLRVRVCVFGKRRERST